MADVCIAIQARLGSSRLPRKIELPFQSSKSLLDCIAEKWKSISTKEVTILAPRGEINDLFWKSFTSRHNVFFGDDNNLLKRYWEFSSTKNYKNIVRVTGDNPFVHIDIFKKTLDFHLLNNADYTSSKRDDGAIIPYGIGVEIFSVKALERIYDSSDIIAQEHVSEAFLASKELKSLVMKNPLGISHEMLNRLSYTIDEHFQYDFWNKLI